MNRLPNHSKAGESRSRTFPICQALRAGSFAGLLDASRYSGNAADRTEFLLSNERPCGRSGRFRSNNRRSSHHAGFQAELAKRIDGVRPEGRPAATFANRRRLAR